MERCGHLGLRWASARTWCGPGVEVTVSRSV